MRVFLDTNVLAAAFATRGLCSDLFEEVLKNHDPVLSIAILAELKRVLAKKFGIPDDRIGEILDLLGSSSYISVPGREPSYPITDSDDMSHLCAAENAGCAVFITGDKELQALDPIGAMRVLSPRGFWEMFELSRP
uniref:Putative toxin-antitoxin system toxin component, PIN family n=1 Tax=Candidatus Kentrum sp. FW TaxID=2126338 RepID=A0A450TV22_9GAMM|nr:MAG: putative toxin-antitoxin system toxin component, PIN family [Candidatus Kentron sp. FW]